MKKIPYEILEGFVGRKSDYYLLKWRAMEITGSQLSWNWTSSILGILWLAYRKMYGYMLFFVFFIFLPELFKFEAALANFANFTISIAIFFILGLFGNYLYYRHARKKIYKIQSKLNIDNFEDKIFKSGGTSYWPVIALLLFIIFLGVIATVMEEY